ncbi:MAG: hypothetical protein A2672_02000 [Candidatus Wildermuthbacteria bacterium RIFCSPHIGHO2_01_FULL_49_22b]|uniref:Uncharacterized protein n=1 Tax=Candidatus Wildermuthbacteria bacterium RIFCSPHIGHO2_01_FULL_49_22b TaxID=1802448 RepID=A0A1G2QXR2_9BACT|nr:MAG: hypothetical protein A2672_02000 [Candidatus Wildermuthbacteria bacterium RIFCSPHIGHO2_01_FULL_49_22b]
MSIKVHALKNDLSSAVFQSKPAKAKQLAFYPQLFPRLCTWTLVLIGALPCPLHFSIMGRYHKPVAMNHE